MIKSIDKIKPLVLLVVSILICQSALAQPITLQECYERSQKNYPLVKKQDLIKLNSKYLLVNANRAYFPQFNVQGQATYQSEVTQFPQIAPNITLPTLSKDQYRLQAELVQTIFDGGFRTSQINLIKSQELIQTKQVEVSMAAVKQQITDLYFAILMFDAQLKQHQILKSNLTNTLEKTKAALAHGTTFKSSVDELKAEIINAEMVETDLQNNRQAMIETLALLIGRSLPDTTVFSQPQTPEILSPQIKRPELRLIDLQKENLIIQKKQAKSDLLPTISAFGTGGYGRPTLNILNNNFGTYWMAGLRFKWSLNTLISLPYTVKSLQMNDRMLDVDKETFSLNTKIAMDKQQSEINKYQLLIAQDNDAITLRESVMTSAKAQLENGVITTTDYISKLNAEHLARQMKHLHELQLLKAKYNYLTISGN